MKQLLLKTNLITIAFLWISSLNASTTNFMITNPCIGNQTTLTSNSLATSGTIVSYQWDLNNDGNFSDATGSSITHAFLATGTYTIGHRIITSTNDTAIIYKNVTIYVRPISHFTPSNACLGDSVTLINSTSIPIGSILNNQWNFDNGFETILTGNPKYLYNTSGVYNVRLISLSDHGCKDTTYGIVTIFNLPNLSITNSGDSNIFAGKSTTLSVVETGLSNILWSTGQTTNNIEVTNAGTYYASTIGANQCLGKSNTIKIKVLPVNAISADNILSPNNDGDHDIFVINNLIAHDGAEVSVYNRYGVRVFMSSNYSNDWTGGDLPEGTYYYVIKCKDNSPIVTGDINIIR